MGLVGESGCGKSTVALGVMQDLGVNGKIVSGSIKFKGRDLSTLSADELRDIRGSEIAMIYQEPMASLNPAMRIGNQLTEVPIIHEGKSKSDAHDLALQIVEDVRLPDPERILNSYPHQLSGGQQQRIVIAMALMSKPSLLILDEPTTALDVTVQVQILRLLAELQAEFDMALVLISHDLGIVARTADRVAVMYAGQIVETGSSEQVFASPVHPYTQGLLDCIPHPGRRRGEPLGSIAGVVPTLIGRREGCMFRNRCPVAEVRCRRRGDELREADAGHEYRCVHDAGRLLSRTEA